MDFGTTTVGPAILTAIGEVTVIFGLVLVAILSLWAAQIGLGWGLKKFAKWNGLRKF